MDIGQVRQYYYSKYRIMLDNLMARGKMESKRSGTAVLQVLKQRLRDALVLEPNAGEIGGVVLVARRVMAQGKCAESRKKPRIDA